MFKIIVFCAVFQLITGASVPSYIQKCSLSDPNIEKCLLKATVDIKPYIKNGIPELGFPSLNPFVIPLLELQQGTDAVNFKLTLRNVEVQGFEDYKFEKFNYNPKTFYFDGLCHFNQLHIETDYEITGKILAVQINGKGRHITEIGANSSGTLMIKGELIEKKGKEYFNPITAEAKIEISNFTSKFEGIFSENEDITKATNMFINDNSQEVLNELLPTFEKVAADIFIKMIETYTRSVPYKILFLD